MNSESIPSSYIRPSLPSNNGTSSSTSRNGNNRRTRRRPRLYRFVPGSRLPSGMLPPVPLSLDVTNGNTDEDYAGSALAVLRSTKRQKYCVDDEQETPQQHQDHEENDTNDSKSNRPQTPSTDNGTPRGCLPGSLAAVACNTSVLLPQELSRPKGWEWSIGILPPPLSEDLKCQLQQRQTQQLYSRMITPLLYSTKFPSGRNTTTSSTTY